MKSRTILSVVFFASGFIGLGTIIHGLLKVRPTVVLYAVARAYDGRLNVVDDYTYHTKEAAQDERDSIGGNTVVVKIEVTDIQNEQLTSDFVEEREILDNHIVEVSK